MSRYEPDEERRYSHTVNVGGTQVFLLLLIPFQGTVCCFGVDREVANRWVDFLVNT